MQVIETSIKIADNLSLGEFERSILSWIKRAKGLNYQGMILDITGNADDSEKINIIKEIRNQNHDFTIFTRCTCKFNERKSIKDDLNNIRVKLKVDCIAIRSNNQDVLNFIAKDSRVDIIKLEDYEARECFTVGVASLASQAGVFVELPIDQLILARGTARSKIIRSFKKIIEKCENKRTNLLLSSDATNFFGLKNPWQKAITLGLLLDSNRQLMRKIIYKNPYQLISKIQNYSHIIIKEVEE
ncbi:MAG: RNase P subunit p30 family protein [Candidatus Hodarchaeota archaeon]